MGMTRNTVFFYSDKMFCVQSFKGKEKKKQSFFFFLKSKVLTLVVEIMEQSMH